jgi:cbb3-type cytochrome c oxidase subunit III
MKKLLVMVAMVSCLASTASIAQSKVSEYYNDRYCMTCHGVDGIGNESISAPRLAGMEPWYLKRQLELFRSGTRGTHQMDEQGLEMQAMAAKLTDASIVDIVEWVATWEYVPAPITVAGDVEAGKALFTVCATCHGEEGEGSEAFGSPALAGQNDWYLVTQLRNFKAGYRGRDPKDSFGSQMVAMSSMFHNDTAIKNIVSYINTLGR